MLSTGRCESCHAAAVLAEVHNPAEAELSPFRVCQACERRLLSRSLRPREWFHLRALHGWREDLDDYDDDGQAGAPDVPVEEPEAHPFPTASSLRVALDIAYVKYVLPRTLLPVFAADPVATLALLEADVAARGRSHLRVRAYEIAALALGRLAESFVRACWSEGPGSETMFELARASASCLPRDEALARVLAAIVEPDNAVVTRIAWLRWFQDDAALDALERLVVPPVMDSWGDTAAACGLSWARASRWLDAGRPLSLVALDALDAVRCPRTTRLQELAPSLHDAPDHATIRAALEEHARVDPSPRVKKIVARLVRAYR